MLSPQSDYKLEATVASFRAPSNVWQKMDNNCQVNINPKSTSSEADTLEWTLMTGINIAENVFSTRDRQRR